jgi:Ca2+-binding EF-hand superfamily protein
MSFKNSFEKELKNKLLMKTVGNQSEEMVLLKAFKYFDLSNSNLCDRDTFLKAVMKIGITGFSEQNILSVFDFYDTDNTGKINYKDFIGILYNNPSIMDNPEKLNENPKKKIIHMHHPALNLVMQNNKEIKISMANHLKIYQKIKI